MELYSNAKIKKRGKLVIFPSNKWSFLVAIKKFKDMIDSSKKLHKIAMREVKMLKEMKHENIVHLKEAF